MASSIIGSLIAIMATSALALAINVLESSYRNAVRYPLTLNEIKLLQSANLYTEENKQLLKNDLENLPQSYE